MLQLTLVCPSPQELIAAISGAASLLTAALTLNKTQADRIPNDKIAFFISQFFMVLEERKFNGKATAWNESLPSAVHLKQRNPFVNVKFLTPNGILSTQTVKKTLLPIMIEVPETGHLGTLLKLTFKVSVDKTTSLLLATCRLAIFSPAT